MAVADALASSCAAVSVLAVSDSAAAAPPASSAAAIVSLDAASAAAVSGSAAGAAVSAEASLDACSSLDASVVAAGSSFWTDARTTEREMEPLSASFTAPSSSSESLSKVKSRSTKQDASFVTSAPSSVTVSTFPSIRAVPALFASFSLAEEAVFPSKTTREVPEAVSGKDRPCGSV